MRISNYDAAMKLLIRTPLSVLSVCMYFIAFLSTAGTKHCADQLSEKSTYQNLFHGDHSIWPESELSASVFHKTDKTSQCMVPVTRIRSQPVPASPNEGHQNHSKNRNNKNSSHRKLKGTKKQRKKERRKKLKKKNIKSRKT